MQNSYFSRKFLTKSGVFFDGRDLRPFRSESGGRHAGRPACPVCALGNFYYLCHPYDGGISQKIRFVGSRFARGSVARDLVGVQCGTGRSCAAGQRRGLLPPVRRTAGVGLFRSSARDGAAGLAGRTPLRRRAGRAFLLHGAAAPLPLDPVAADPPGRCLAPRCGALRGPCVHDADAPDLRLHRRARRSAADDLRALPAGFRTLLRTPAPGLAVDGCGHGPDGLQQIPRGAGGPLLPGGQSAAAPAPDALSFGGRGGPAARAAPDLAVQPRLGVVRLPPLVAQLGLPV